ncbi:LacI family DNA-binding transcriptional regulator [Cerasicoccus arenae]|uniref:LacI family transcriptional regulator n=1 Tax=Cerasicoccus arenae TaxID=424488 RepID=A0A8J3GEV9_9BACT|nr:LacI family DNA-binding transcriptional regulator [Cerasicoccus arenae]MBK1859271.1 LacI family DNA-binding transcriptional regulator [Cerasicoccus arenae]GHC01587.1 LacI family transcriptional regulator [Cerasicoccus arenae]
MNPRLTQKNIADQLGLHVTTVSKALKGDLRIAEATRLMVNKKATELGYAPDPYLTSLASYRKSQRSKNIYRATIGWVFNHDRQTNMAIFPGYSDILQGARKRAQCLGYRIDEFWLGEKGMTEKRLAAILDARRIDGVIIAPQSNVRGSLSLPWQRLAAVSIGHTLVKPELPIVATDHFRAMTSLLEILRARNYRRIGISMWRQDNERMDRRAYSAFMAHSEGQDIVIDLYDVLDRNYFIDWFTRNRLDAVVVRSSEIIGWLRAAGYAVPDKVGVVGYTLSDEETELSGIYHSHARVGELAVDRLARMLQFGERGLPDCSERLLVSARWREGCTVRSV